VTRLLLAWNWLLRTGQSAFFRRLTTVFGVWWLLDRLVYFATQTLWFAAQEAGDLWRLRCGVQVGVFSISFLLLSSLSLWMLHAFLPERGVQSTLRGDNRLIAWLRFYQQRARRFAMVALTLLILLLSWRLAAPWTQWIDFWQAPSWGVREKYFRWDAGLYLFRLPLWHLLHDALWQFLTVLLMCCGVLFAAQSLLQLPSRVPDPRLLRSRRVLCCLGAAWFGALSVAYGLNLLDDVVAPRESSDGLVSSGYRYADWYVSRPANWLGIVLSLGCALWLLRYALGRPAKSGRAVVRNWPRLAGCGVLAYAAPGIFSWLLFGPVQAWLVEPDPAREVWFKNEAARLTQTAWGMERIESTSVRLRSLSPSLKMPRIPLWHEANFFQSRHPREIRPANTVFHLDRYVDVIAVNAFETAGQWQVEAASATRVDAEGQPLAPGWGRLTALSYGPSPLPPLTRGDRGDVPLQRFWQRVLWSWRLRAPHLLWNRTNAVAFPRDVRERAGQLLPFCDFPDASVPVFLENRWHWMLDGVTASRAFPGADLLLDESTGDGVLVREAIKVLIDSQSGKLRAWVSDERTRSNPQLPYWQQRFPRLIQSRETMPRVVREHLRYPPTLLQGQLRVAAKYFNGRNTAMEAGDITTVPQRDSLVQQGIVRERLSGRIVALLRATGGAEYGQLQLLRFAGSYTFGGSHTGGTPRLPVDALTLPRLEEEAERRLAGTTNGTTLQGLREAGKVLLVPLQDVDGSWSLPVVQPLYEPGTESASGEEAPRSLRLRGVAVGDATHPEQTAGVGRTVSQALARLETLRNPRPLNFASRLREALDLHDAAQRAAKDGNWARAGLLWQQHRALLRELYESSQTTP
jgi:hypothetical protein